MVENTFIRQGLKLNFKLSFKNKIFNKNEYESFWQTLSMLLSLA
jgi:hypothetical protein